MRISCERIKCDYCMVDITDTPYAVREESGFDACCREHLEILRDWEVNGVKE